MIKHCLQKLWIDMIKYYLQKLWNDMSALYISCLCFTTISLFLHLCFCEVTLDTPIISVEIQKD